MHLCNFCPRLQADLRKCQDLTLPGATPIGPSAWSVEDVTLVTTKAASDPAKTTNSSRLLEGVRNVADSHDRD